MASPYLITGPAYISFSGGRSSGKLLKEIVDAHGGTLPDDVVVGFSNTGKEMPESLDFVQECGDRWNVPIVWLEYDPTAEHSTRIVNHNSASRSGEPFSALLDRKPMLPNPRLSYCTIELKIRRMREYCVHHLGWKRWTSVVGFRADEKRRTAKLPARNAARKDRWETIAPMDAAGVTNADVLAWWARQPFDLRLPVDEKLKTPFGNCDFCLKNSLNTALYKARLRPDLMQWWIEQEKRHPEGGNGGLFRIDRPSYAEIHRLAQQSDVEADDDGESIDCACTD